jgi:predicted ATP-dependent serine protease
MRALSRLAELTVPIEQLDISVRLLGRGIMRRELGLPLMIASLAAATRQQTDAKTLAIGELDLRGRIRFPGTSYINGCINWLRAEDDEDCHALCLERLIAPAGLSEFVQPETAAHVEECATLQHALALVGLIEP